MWTLWMVDPNFQHCRERDLVGMDAGPGRLRWATGVLGSTIFGGGAAREVRIL